MFPPNAFPIVAVAVEGPVITKLLKSNRIWNRILKTDMYVYIIYKYIYKYSMMVDIHKM